MMEWPAEDTRPAQEENALQQKIIARVTSEVAPSADLGHLRDPAFVDHR